MFDDPLKYGGLDPEGNALKSFQQLIAERRNTMSPTVAAQQPAIPGIPALSPTGGPASQQSQQLEPQAIAGMRNQLNQVAGMQAPTPAQPAPGAPTTPQGPLTPEQQMAQNFQALSTQIHPKMVEQVLKQVQDLAPPKLVGYDVLGTGRGGIMGTGVEPLDVLAFALGVGTTWNLPQHQAQEMTWKLAGMPRAYKESQRKAASEFLSQAAQAANVTTGMSNAQTAQVKAAQAQRQYDSRLGMADVYRRVGRGADALAIEADAVSEHIALSGGAAPDRLPTNLVEVINGIAVGALDPLEQPKMLKSFGIDPTSPTARQEAIVKARAWRQSTLGGRPPVALPSGGAAGMTVEGPRPIGEIPGATDIQAQMEQDLARIRGGQPAAMAIPTTPRAPGAVTSGATVPIQPSPQAGPAPQIRGLGVAEQLTQSPDPKDQKRGAALGDMPVQTRSRIDDLYAKPIPESTRQQLIAQMSTREYANELEQAHQRMTESYRRHGRKVANETLKLALAEIKREIPDDAWLTTKISASFIGNAMQQKGNFTPEAIEFGTLLAQAQRFAKGSLNDAANLANKERQMFNFMIGDLWDSPAFFRQRVQTFQRQIAAMYNTTLKQSGLYNTQGFEPMTAPEAQAAGPQTGTVPPKATPVPPTPRQPAQSAAPGQPGSPWQFIQPGPARPGSDY